MPRQSLAEYLDIFYRFESETALVHRRGYRTVRWSYRLLAETACQFARHLESSGINQGDCVFLWAENCSEWVAAFWGTVLRGAVAVPMDNIASPEFARQVCGHARAKLLVCSREKPSLDCAAPVVILESLTQTLAPYAKSRYQAAPGERRNLAEIIFTSGATAEPKGVAITHGNILANVEPLEAEIAKYKKYERWVHPLRFLDVLPLSHVFGQIMSLFIVPLLGGTVVFQESLNPSDLIRTIKSQRVSVIITVPRLLETLKNKLEAEAEINGKRDWLRQQLQTAEKEKFLRRWWRFRSLHRRLGWKFWAFISGGAALDPEVERFWSRLAFVVIQGYGLTETTSLISVNHPFRIGKGSIGKVLPGREIKLDASGEILVRGESVATGYWQGQQLQPVLGEEGWFHTGDLGALDASGNLYFRGRKKNVIVTAEGMNVYPDDLEAAIRRQPEVRDCIVLGVPINGREQPYAVLILNHRTDAGADAQAAEAAIRRANQALADYQQVRQWMVWPEDDFPRTSTQKPRRSVIQEMLAEQLQQNRQPAAAPSGTISELIRKISGRIPAALSANARLEDDLNLSSIDRVELIAALEDRYQIDLDEARLGGATTVGDLEKMLREPAPPRTVDYPAWGQSKPIAWIRALIYYLLVWPATIIRAWPRVRGRENLRGINGPFLIVCNHITEIDVGFVLFALPRRLRRHITVAMNGERLLAMRHPRHDLPWWRRLLDRIDHVLLVALFNVFPLPKQSGFRHSFQFAGESVDRGYSVLVFPEGEVTKTGEMVSFRAGIGVLATKLNIPVVPMRIDGLFEVKQAGRRMAAPGTVQVSIGAPVRFPSDIDPDRIARELQSAVASLRALR